MRLDGFIPLLAGTYFLLVAFRVVNISKSPTANEAWVQKFGTFAKICGPLLILFGIAMVFRLLN